MVWLRSIIDLSRSLTAWSRLPIFLHGLLLADDVPTQNPAPTKCKSEQEHQ